MDDLSTKIAQLEALRATLGDAAVDAALAALRAQMPAEIRKTTGGIYDAAAPDPGQSYIAGDLPTYLRRTMHECNALPLAQLDPADAAHARPLELARVYIGLNITAQADDERQSPKRRPASLSTDEPHPRYRTALEALGCHRRMLLLGAPGSGKTTFVSHLTLCLAGALLAQQLHGEASALGDWLARLPGWTFGALLPIRVILRDFAAFVGDSPMPHSAADLLLEFIAKTLDQSGWARALPHTRAALSEGRAMLLLDGLDEVAGEPTLSRVVTSIRAAAAHFPRSPLLITCRTLDYQAEPQRQIPSMPVETLASLSDDQIQQFVEDWYAELAASGRRPAAHAHADAQALHQALNLRPELIDLARLPLLLTVMALVHASRGTLPEARALLYYECIDLLLLRWRQPRGEADLLARFALSQFRSSDLLALMARLGFVAHERATRSKRTLDGSADLSTALVMRVLTDAFAQYDPMHKHILAERMLNALATGNGLLLQRGPDVYAFPHRTFQEFLAGYHIKGRRDVRELCLARAPRSGWHEVLTLMVGYQVLADRELEKPLEMVEQLLLRSPTERALAGEILNLIGRERAASYDPALLRARGLWPRARATLFDLIERGQAPAAPVSLRVRAGLALGTLCYGSLDTLCRAETTAPLPDPRLPLAVVGLKAARGPSWRAALANYWCAIKAGMFWHGDDREDEPLQQVELPHAYQVARYPVTNADFARFVADGGYTERRWWTREGWKRCKQEEWTAPRWFDDAGDNNPLQPVTGVSWYEAVAYCHWLTGQGHAQGWLPEKEELRLPTWLEWERAARHIDKRRYPWGDVAPDAERANYAETGIGRPAPVGCFPAGAAACGALDLAGNVMEWTATLYEEPQALAPQKDFTSEQRAICSYSEFNDEKEHLCCGTRSRFNSYSWYVILGFRVIRSLRAPV